MFAGVQKSECIAVMVEQYGLDYVDLSIIDPGIPKIMHIITAGERVARSNFVMYINSDIVMPPGLTLTLIPAQTLLA